MVTFLFSGSVIGALLFGLAGSLHCLGMCGGVAGMAMLLHDAPARQWRWLCAWQGGRLISYTVVGALSGGLGQILRLVPLFSLAQAALVGLTSAALVLSGVALMGFRTPLQRLEQHGAMGFMRLLPLLKPWMPPRTPWRALVMGGCWGLVPCGFLYTMVAAAAALGTPTQGALMMAGFAFGTMPMLFMAASGIRLGLLKQHYLRWIVGLVVAASGVFGMGNMLNSAGIVRWICG